MIVLPESGGGAAQPPAPLARMPMGIRLKIREERGQEDRKWKVKRRKKGKEKTGKGSLNPHREIMNMYVN